MIFLDRQLLSCFVLTDIENTSYEAKSWRNLQYKKGATSSCGKQWQSCFVKKQRALFL